MKKLLILLTGITVILTGCGSAKEVTSTAEVQTPPETTQMTETLEELQETETPEETIPETTQVQTEETIPDTTELEETAAETEEEEEDGWKMHPCVPNASPTASRNTEAPSETEETSVSEAELVLETDLEEETEQETETIPPKPDKGIVVNAYISAIHEKIAEAKQLHDGSDDFSITYSLYDMDGNGTPELLLQYGTCEADYRIVIYTVEDNALKLVADDVAGGHTGFAYDYVANQLVLAHGHMGSGIMTWYDLDENGNLRYLIDSEPFEFAGEGLPEYEDVMKKYNVAWLDGVEAFSISGEMKTYLYTYESGEYSSQEYSGLDFRYLQDYPF